MWEILKSWRADNHALGTAGAIDSPMQRHKAQPVSFRDATIHMEDEEEEPAGMEEALDSSQSSPRLTKQRRLERNKLIIIMVGLPGRGKTFLCNKVVCYLNWLGHHTRLFNVGSYRRFQKDANEKQDATFFDHHNVHGMEARQRALEAALIDLKLYLNSELGQVAIFDATNTTAARRQRLINEFHGTYQYLFIESICRDEVVLEQNYRYKMRYSPDYKGMSEAEALRDFKDRIMKYEEVYEELNDRTNHWIKLIDMVTGRGYMDINRISGYLPGKIVFFLMQVCKAGIAQERKIWLTRHGESAYNESGKIGGDPALSPLGAEYAKLVPAALMERMETLEKKDEAVPLSVWTSTLKRTIQTAQHLPFPKLRWKALDEIHAGSCDGMTYKEISKKYPEEYSARIADKLRYRYPAGESYLDVIQRLEPVVIEIEREKECVLVVAHQAVLRAIYGYFVAADLNDIPTLEIPLHSLIELKPLPDGTMHVEVFPLMDDPGTGAHPSLPPQGAMGETPLPITPTIPLLGPSSAAHSPVAGNFLGGQNDVGRHSRNSSTTNFGKGPPTQGGGNNSIHGRTNSGSLAGSPGALERLSQPPQAAGQGGSTVWKSEDISKDFSRLGL